MALSETMRSSILKLFAGKNPSISMSNSYIGLLTAEPSANEQGVMDYHELPTSGGYVRTLIGNSSAPISQLMGNPVNGKTENTGFIFFQEATADWPRVTHFALYAAQTGGEPFLWGALSTPITVQNGYIPMFRPGTFKLTLT